MENSYSLFVTFVLFIILYFAYIYYTDTRQYVKSSYDNNTYIINRVNKSEEFLQDSANMLAEINKKVLLLKKHMDSFKNIPKYHFVNFFKNYKPSILSEASIDSRYTTYTVNKEEIHICLRTRDSKDKLYDINLLMYVVLHELAHFINYNKDSNPIMGHGSEFLDIFEFLVKEAINIGIYKYENYNLYPKEYCNIILDSTII